MTPFYQQQKRSTSRRDLFAILPFILLCFLGESKLEPLTSAAQVKERGKRKREREKKSFISCTSGLELHLELITPPSSSESFLTETQPTLPSGSHGNQLCLKGTKELGSGSPGFCQWSGKFSLWKEKLTCDQVSQELIVKSCLVWASPEDLRFVLQLWLLL